MPRLGSRVRVSFSAHERNLVRSNKRVTQKSPGGGMVDAHVSGACVERHAGSSPVLGTTHEVFVSGGMAELVDAPL